MGSLVAPPSTAIVPSGPQPSAFSESVVIATDQLPIPIVLRDVGGQPISLGPAVAAESLPVVLAQDQEPIPVYTDSTSSVTAILPPAQLVTLTPLGTVTALQGLTPWADNLVQVGGVPISLGRQPSSMSIPTAEAADTAEVFQLILAELQVMRAAIVAMACEGGRFKPDDFVPGVGTEPEKVNFTN